MNLNIGTLLGNVLFAASASTFGHSISEHDYGLLFYMSGVLTIAGQWMTNHYAYRAGVISCMRGTP